MVGVGLHDRLVNNLLKLLVLQVGANHHLENDEELAVADKSISINVVDLERKAQLLLLVSLAGESTQAGDEFLEVDVATSILVKDCDEAVVILVIRHHPSTYEVVWRRHTESLMGLMRSVAS